MANWKYDPTCFCGTTLSNHSLYDNHSFTPMIEAEDEIDYLDSLLAEYREKFDWLNSQSDIQIWKNRNNKFSMVINDDVTSVQEGYFIGELIGRFMNGENNEELVPGS